MTGLKPCPFCGMTVHWEDGCGIVHDKVVVTCIVDLVYPLESNMHIPKEMWIKKWNMRTGMIEPIFSREEKVDLKPCPFCGGKAHVYQTVNGGTRKLYFVECLECFAKAPCSLDRPDATKDSWNKRVNE